MQPCPFCLLPEAASVARNVSAVATRDRFPVSPGHTLIIPRRHVETWWEATAAERADLMALVDEVRERLDAEHRPDGYNVGFNAGAAAGQTVAHLHLHVIPRYAGDVDDPRGGIRHVIPDLGNYLASGPAGSAAATGAAAPQMALIDNSGTLVRDMLRDCLGDRRFDRADLVVSFVMRSGVELIAPLLSDALDRGVRVRVLTTDYLGTTEAVALARLLDLSESADGLLEVRIFSDETTSFHPKGYLFWSSSSPAALALVGSSNLSRSGIVTGIEWNLVTGHTTELVAGFEALWDDPRSVTLDHAWLRSYRLRAPERPAPAPTPGGAGGAGGAGSPDRPDDAVGATAEQRDGELPDPAEVVEPRPIQEEALIALKASQQEGHQAALVVLATGLGKTWLAAFFARERGARRVLFVAHREEILRQSRDVFRRVIPDCDAGLFTADERAPDAETLFGSVQSVGRNLHRFPPEHFELVVVDEFHHAAASTYRRIIEHFRPGFLLGLTATPDRLDGADLLALCGDNVAFSCGLVEGIERGELCPFSYVAERDVADFATIPWRNGRFDPVALAAAVETERRAEQELEAWRRHGGRRTLAFCCSVSHARFMADWFAAHGVAAVAVHSGPQSAPRQQALADLAAGEIEVIFSVDLFNEGVDVPEIDTVLMLRPTESPVVFLQQLGRGLRVAPGKERLTVIDFIGNHRSFLLKPRTLLALSTGEARSALQVLEAMRSGDFDLPPGCSVSYDLESVELMSELARRERGSALERFCREYAGEHGRRPTAVQAWRSGYNPAASRPGAGGWFATLGELGLLDGGEQVVVQRHGELLRGIEREAITKSYKLVTLQAFLDLDGLAAPVPLPALADRSRQILRGDPRLAADVGAHLDDSPAEWLRYWREWPVAAWVGELRGEPGGTWFVLDSKRQFRLRAPVTVGDVDGLRPLIEELVDYRLCRYLDSRAPAEQDSWVLRVGQTNGRPIVWLNREQNSGLPEGTVEVVADGKVYEARFVKIALNVLTEPGSTTNVLPDLLRRWFGPDAGAPGRSHQLSLWRSERRFLLLPAVP